MLTFYLLFKIAPKIVLFEYAAIKFIIKATAYLAIIAIILIILLII